MKKELIKISAFALIYLTIVPITAMNAIDTVTKAYYTMALEEAKGKIISSDVQTELKKGFFSSDVKTTYRAHITYVYRVNRVSYLGRGIEFKDESFDTIEEAKALVRKYHLNRRVPIFYSTINPDRAVIIKPSTMGPLILTILGTLITLYMTLTGGFFIAGGGIKKLKEDLKKPKEESKPTKEVATPKTEKPKEKETPKPQAITEKSPSPEPPTKLAVHTPKQTPPVSQTRLKPTPTGPTEKVIIKKPTANPLSVGKPTNEAKPKIVSTTSLKPPANKPKK